MKRSAAINRVSSKQARVYRARKKLTPSDAPPCEWPWMCGRLAQDWNEKLLASRGGSRVDTKNRIWYCREHHEYFHAHPEEMHELGLMPHAWDKEQPLEAGREGLMKRRTNDR